MSTPQEDLMMYACVRGNLERAKQILAESKVNGQDVNVQRSLRMACSSGQLEIVKWLTTEGKADVYAKDEKASTLLHAACFHEQPQMAQWLVLECGMYPGQPNKFGETPLHFACYSESLDLVKWLVVDCKADPDLRTRGGISSRDLANRDTTEWLSVNCKK